MFESSVSQKVVQFSASSLRGPNTPLPNARIRPFDNAHSHSELEPVIVLNFQEFLLGRGKGPD